MVEELNEFTCGFPYTVHPAAELFPLVEGEEFDRLVQSIREHGIQNPVVFGWNENEKPVLLDGRNRLRAAERLKAEGVAVPVPAVGFDYPQDGITEVEWIEAQNLDRRHLPDEARAMLAAQLHEMIEAESAKAKEQSQFNSETAKAAAVNRHDKAVTADSASPQKRDRKKSEARTTAGKVGAKAKVSKHKAKQAIAVVKAIKAGTLSPDVAKDVIAEKKKLRDAVPAKAKGKPAKSAPAKTTDAISVEIRNAAEKAWQRLKDKFALDEHAELRKVLAGIIRDEQKQIDK
jgi:ParB-like chromosome segregation protein Spo0J